MNLREDALSRWEASTYLDASKSAAQRRKNVATAAGRGLWCCDGMSPFRGERVTSRDTFRRTGQSILCTEDDVCKQVGIGMPHGDLHWAKGGPIIRRRPGKLSPLKGAYLSPNRWSTACGRDYILSPLRGSLGCVKYVDVSRWEKHERSECKRDSAQP